MTTYIIRRLLLIIPTFIAITMIVFTLCRKLPDSPIERQKLQMLQAMANEGGGSGPMSAGDINQKMANNELSDEDKEMLMKHYNMSDNIVADYFRWLGSILQLDFGKSIRYDEPVLSLIFNRMPISLYYGLITLFFIYGICIPLGIVKALKNNTSIDNMTSVVVFFGYAIPGYALGAILLVYLASMWQIFPLGGFVSENFDQMNFFQRIGDIVYHSFLPLCCYLVGAFAVTTMLMKNTLLENLSADYIRTALAKGVPYKRAVFKHALDNSLIPLATHFGSNISILLAGSFLIEKVFNIEGMGLLGFTSLEERDTPVVMGILAISCLLQMVGNLLSDICVAYVDPRVRFE